MYIVLRVILMIGVVGCENRGVFLGGVFFDPLIGVLRQKDVLQLAKKSFPNRFFDRSDGRTKDVIVFVVPVFYRTTHTKSFFLLLGYFLFPSLDSVLNIGIYICICGHHLFDTFYSCPISFIIYIILLIIIIIVLLPRV